MLVATPEGPFCARGGFHVDPAVPVERAVLTHLHADHARPGVRVAHLHRAAEGIARRRLPGTELVLHDYGEPFRLGDVELSLHPAGHVLGSAQLRMTADETWVVTGDFKRDADPTCTPFELIRCDVLVTEATFGLPVYCWPAADAELDRLVAWWEQNTAAGRATLVYAYAFGKAQRLLAELARRSDRVERDVLVHGAVAALCDDYRSAGIPLPDVKLVRDEPKRASWAGRLVLAPPSVRRSPWVRRFGDHETAFVSGWMRVRGARRGRGVDRGFVLSDHADWSALIRTVRESGARRVLATHGFAGSLARHLRETYAIDADVLPTAWEGEAGAERTDDGGEP